MHFGIIIDLSIVIGRCNLAQSARYLYIDRLALCTSFNRFLIRYFCDLKFLSIFEPEFYADKVESIAAKIASC